MVVSLSLVFFFFKQKTAYEMRISDWSSDVCSSDLKALAVARANGTFDSMEALARRAELPGRALRSLADADACRSIGVDRREALWEARPMPDDVLPPLSAPPARSFAPEAASRPPAIPPAEPWAPSYQNTRL